jgi:hypothetical protein
MTSFVHESNIRMYPSRQLFKNRYNTNKNFEQLQRESSLANSRSEVVNQQVPAKQMNDYHENANRKNKKKLNHFVFLVFFY